MTMRQKHSAEITALSNTITEKDLEIKLLNDQIQEAHEHRRESIRAAHYDLEIARLEISHLEKALLMAVAPAGKRKLRSIVSGLAGSSVQSGQAH